MGLGNNWGVLPIITNFSPTSLSLSYRRGFPYPVIAKILMHGTRGPYYYIFYWYMICTYIAFIVFITWNFRQ